MPGEPHRRTRVLLSIVAVAPMAVIGCGATPTKPTDPRPLPSGTIFRQGTFDLPQAYALDLDTGALQTSLSKSGDVWFRTATPTERFLTPEVWNGATLSIAGPSDPGHIGCSARGALLTDDIPVESLSAGVYLCARTSENRTAVLRIVAPPRPSGPDAVISFSYTVFVD